MTVRLPLVVINGAIGELPTGDSIPAPATSTPAPHASSHASGGSDPVTPAAIGAAAVSHVHSGADITTGTVAYARLPVGTAASTIAAGDDTRLTNARTPTAHAATHAAGGSDVLTPAAIGAVALSTITTKGDLLLGSAAGVIARLGVSGTSGYVLTADSTQALGVKWASVTVPTQIPPGPSSGSILNIGDRPGQNHFNLGAGRLGDAAVTTYTLADLAGGVEDPVYFPATADKQRVSIYAPLAGPPTSGSSYERVEFRELDELGNLAAFDPTLPGTHRMSGTTNITYLNATNPAVIIAQFHNGDTGDRVSIRTQLVSGQIKLLARVNGVQVIRFSENYLVGTEFSWKIEVINNQVFLYYNDMVTPVYTSATNVFTQTAVNGGLSWYFKFGSYNQTTPAESGSTEYSRVLVSGISHWHTGWATPAKFYAVPRHAATHATGGYDAITPAAIGAAATAHTHSGADITSGTVAYARLPVGTTTGSVAAGDDSRFTDARTPAAHAASHASGGSDPVTPAAIGAAATSHVHAGADITSGTVAYARLPVGTAASTVAAGDDTRFTNARTPTAHASTHATGGSDAVSPASIGAASTTHASTHASGGSDPVTPAAIGAAATSHVHSGADITTGTVAYARLPVGTAASTVAAGDDTRFTNARTPTAHASTHASGGSDPVTPAAIGAAATSHTHAGSDITTGTVAYARLPVGTAASTVAAGDDTRFTNARTPTAHASTHALGGSDVLTPWAINAIRQPMPTVTVTSNYTANDGELVIADATGGGFTITLPTLTTSSTVGVKRVDGIGANLVTVAAASGQSIGSASAATVPIRLMDQTAIYVANLRVATNWLIERSHLSLAALDARYPAVATLSAKGDIYVATGAGVVVRQAVGTDGYALIADSSLATGVKWAQVSMLGGGNPTGAAGGSLAGTYPNPSIAVGAIGSSEIATAIKDPAVGTAGLRTLGYGAVQAAPGSTTPRKWTGGVPVATGTVNGLSITVSGAVVTFTYSNGNTCPAVTIRAGSTPIGTYTAGEEAWVRSIAASDGNSVAVTLPAAPVANNWIFMVEA